MHQRQFVIGPRPWEELAGWTATQLQPGLFLSRCSTLPLRDTEHGDVLGLVVSSDESDHPDSWAGRYVLIRNGVLELDATGILGVFYRRADDEMWVSSSPELIRLVPPQLPEPVGRLKWAVVGEEWFGPPGSGLVGVRRLLPSQRLGLADGAITRRPLLPSMQLPSHTKDVLSDLERRLRRVVSELAEIGPLWLGLTAGMDSRLILAACLAEGVHPVTFTFDLGPDADFPLSRGDREIPPRLAEVAGVAHHVLEPRPYDADAACLYDRHCCFHSVGAERYEVTHRQWEPIPPNAIFVGGNVLEAGRSYYHLHQPPAPPEWHEWVLDTASEMDWRDRLYIEQRLAGWLASQEQAWDITGRPRVHPANCRRLLGAVLTLRRELRARGVHQKLLIERMAPQLAALPANPVPLSGRIRRRWSRERALVDYYGASHYPGARLETLAYRLREWRSMAGLKGETSRRDGSRWS